MTTDSKYGVAKRLMNHLPGSRETLASLYMALPRAISVPLYDLARSAIFRDNARRLPVFEAAFSSIGRTERPGDYLEFGVARGTSLISAAKIAGRHPWTHDMRFHAFDSFEGLPNDEGNFRKGDMSYSKEVFTRFLDRAGVAVDRVTITRGFFDQSLSSARARALQIKPGRAHIVHIDCDLYESTVPVLEFLAPLIGLGSIVIFDDWFSFDDEPRPWEHGEQRAFREWNEHPRFDPLAITHGWNAAWQAVR